MDRDGAPAPDLYEIERRHHDRAVADYLRGDYGSPAGAANELSGAGDGGSAGAGTASAESPRRWWRRRRDRDPSDAALLIDRYRRDPWPRYMITLAEIMEIA